MRRRGGGGAQALVVEQGCLAVAGRRATEGLKLLLRHAHVLQVRALLGLGLGLRCGRVHAQVRQVRALGPGWG